MSACNWTKIESKKGRYFSSNANKQAPSQADIDKYERATRESYKDLRIGSLIGAPVIRHNDSVQSDKAQVRFTSSNEERKGGLLYIRPSDISSFGINREESVSRKHEVFESHKELWPTLENVSIEESVVAHSSNAASWSNVVKAPPRPLPFLKPKEPHSDIEEVHLGEEEQVDREAGGGKKRKKKKKKDKEKLSAPQTLDLGDLIDALKSSKSKSLHTPSPSAKGTPVSKIKKMDTSSGVRNVLDSSAPVTRRGKEREGPKKKKLTPMRKTIMKEREERKKLSEEGQPIPSILDVLTSTPPVPVNTVPFGLHNRKFREYCTHLVTPDINSKVNSMLEDLVRFQDRVYKNEPLKLKTKRRYVCGLREVLKHLELKKMKCAIIPPNLDKIQSPGGINETVSRIIQQCREQEIPVIYALTRRQLAYVLKKKFHIGCVGIISYAGAEEKFKKLTELVATATRDYNRKRDSLLNPVKDTSATTLLPLHDMNDAATELLVEEIESDREEEEEGMEEEGVSLWKDLFPEPDSTNFHDPVHPQLPSTPPLGKHFSWNVSAPSFIPDLGTTEFRNFDSH